MCSASGGGGRIESRKIIEQLRVLVVSVLSLSSFKEKGQGFFNGLVQFVIITLCVCAYWCLCV